MNLVLIAAAVLIVYAVVENMAVLCVRRECFKIDGIKIAHIADLHKRKFGKCNARLCRKTAAEKPDLILISGDLISRDCTDLSSAGATLRSLSAIAPTYMVFGNHETDLSSDMRKIFIEIIKSSGVVFLDKESIQIEIRNRKINLSGLELSYTVYKKNGGYRDLDITDADEINAVLGKKPDGETILMVHNPFFAEAYAEWGADYAISGHVHGGAVMIPFTRIGILSPERRFFPKYTKGIYTVGNMKLLLSGGLGKLRLFNPPEIVIYEI